MIYVNGRFLTQQLTGTQRYAYEVAKRLPGLKLISPLPPRSEYSEIDRSHILVRSGGLRSHLWEQFTLPRVAPPPGVLWSPAGIGPWVHSKHVLTITDIALFQHPEWYRRAYASWYKLFLPLVARRAQRILAISQFTKHAICDQLSIPEERIVVTPLAADEKFVPVRSDEAKSTVAAMGISGDFFLAVGAISARKNLGRLLDAWSIIAPTHPNLKLIIVGAIGISSSDMRSFELRVPGAQHFTHVTDKQLTALYSLALAYVYPSLYEGFGLPILEAMACGAPVVTSNITAMPEVAGDAAILVDPYDVRDIAGALTLLAEDAEMRAHYRHRGLERSRAYGWHRTAGLTFAALRQVEKLIP